MVMFFFFLIRLISAVSSEVYCTKGTVNKDNLRTTLPPQSET